jgi:hypothetical protein
MKNNRRPKALQAAAFGKNLKTSKTKKATLQRD